MLYSETDHLLNRRVVLTISLCNSLPRSQSSSFFKVIAFYLYFFYKQHEYLHVTPFVSRLI
jgi:hypothetical protein